MTVQERRADTHQRGLILRAADQITMVVILAVAFLTLLVYWHLSGVFRGERIDIERATPRELEFQIDLNSADWPELTLLPQVGEVLARRIVDYRSAHGPYRNAQELEKVSGIGPKTIRQVKPYLRIEPVDQLPPDARQ